MASDHAVLHEILLHANAQQLRHSEVLIESSMKCLWCSMPITTLAGIRGENPSGHHLLHEEIREKRTTVKVQKRATSI